MQLAKLLDSDLPAAVILKIAVRIEVLGEEKFARYKLLCTTLPELPACVGGELATTLLESERRLALLKTIASTK